MNLTREQIISARDRARTKLARQRQALNATEAELQLWDAKLVEIDQPQLDLAQKTAKK